MKELIRILEEQLTEIKIKYKDEVNKDSYWRGVMIGLETSINIARELIENCGGDKY